ncbi:MAG: sugar ABC transporter permease [Candidatus Nanopelagicales bacterium]
MSVLTAARGAGAAAPAPRRGSVRRRQRLTVLAFLAPWLLGVAIFFVYPLVDTLYLSFTRYDLLSSPKWVGLSNYVFMATKDPQVVNAAYNTLWLVAILVPARMLFALMVATLVTRLKAGLGVFRTVFYLPALVPPVAGVLAFVFLFNPATGPVNQVLGALGLPQPLWFNDPQLSKPSLVLLGLWGIGDIMIIFLASLLDVPREQYEAAALDGVNPWQRLRYVTLPSISPVLMFAAITGVIAALQYFTEAVVAASVASGQATTGGGNAALLGYPEGSTLTYAQWLYVMGFKNYYLGYASALAVVMFVVSLAVTLVLLRRGGALVHGSEGTR